MYQNILVPLDGSELAECVLPHVKAIAGGCSAKLVTFVSVVEPAFLPVGTGSDAGDVFAAREALRIRDEIEAQNKAKAKEYLGKLTSENTYGAGTRTAVLYGRPAEVIADYAVKQNADLIVIATHGRSGVSRWIWGSVADRLLRAACVPVLMVRASGCVPGI